MAATGSSISGDAFAPVRVRPRAAGIPRHLDGLGGCLVDLEEVGDGYLLIESQRRLESGQTGHQELRFLCCRRRRLGLGSRLGRRSPLEIDLEIDDDRLLDDLDHVDLDVSRFGIHGLGLAVVLHDRLAHRGASARTASTSTPSSAASASSSNTSMGSPMATVNMPSISNSGRMLRRRAIAPGTSAKALSSGA